MNLLDKFDLDNFSLSGFFSEVAVYLDLHAREKTKRLEEEDYSLIIHASEILRKKSREFRKRGYKNISEISFFWEFYGRKSDEADIEKSRNLSVDRLTILGEKMGMIKELPAREVEELRDIRVNLSRKTREYWNSHNPTGFKRYQH